MSTFFTSDLHLGHIFASDKRGFMSTDEHDYTIVENINDTVSKRDKLFIVGDLAFSDAGLKWASYIKCNNIELILGNHDKYPISKFFAVAGVNKIHGFRGYKNFWLSHCPIHPNEMRKKIGNIHGHIHIGGDTPSVEDKRYFNVNVEYHNLKPIVFEEIEKQMKMRIN